MGIHRGSNIIRSGLEFAYDTGYSSTFNNSSNYLHNQGEPTANLLDNSDDWSSNWTGNLFSNWINATVTPNAGVAPDGTTTASKLTGGYSRWQRINCSTSTTYTFSFWIKNIDLPIAPQIHIAFGLNGSLVNYNNVTTIALNTIGEWTRVSKTHTSPSSGINQMEVGVTWSSNYPNTDSVLVWHAMCEQNSHMTPFAYKNNDRSATNSLLDITGQRNINVSNASFDSDAHIDLDGTGDYLSLGSDITFKTNGASGGWTVESVVKYDSVAGGYNNSTSPANFIGSSGISYNSWFWSVLSGKLALWNMSPGVWKYGSTTLAADTWYHTVLTCFGDGSSYQMYLNGNAEGGDHVSYSWNTSYSGLKVQYFGAGQTSRRYVNGKIPITRIYNRALSAVEVKQNFNAYKDRFNM